MPSAMSRRGAFVGSIAGLTACSLVTSLDGYAGRATGEAPEAGADAGEDVVTPGDGATSDASVDASALRGCDAPGLLAYWPMDEGQGGVASECAGRYPATLTGVTSWTTRAGRAAVAFAGAGYLALGDQKALDAPGPKTVAGWMRSTSAPAGYAALFWGYTPPVGYEIVLDGSGLLYANVGLGNAGNVSAVFGTLAAFDWRHVAFVFEPGVRLEVYLDGVSVGKATTLEGDGGALPDSGPAPGGNALSMGVVYGGKWEGAVDDVRIFGRALSAAEIAVLAKD